MIDVVVPTFGRPHRLAAVAANIAATTHHRHHIRFVVEPADTESAAAVEAIGLTPVINERTSNYAGALNTAYESSDADWLFTGADDLAWSDGWDIRCLEVVDDWFAVIGTNDLLNANVLRGVHSTHSLVAREYLDTWGGVADLGPGSFYPECFDHNYCDTEFVATAKMRARFRPCLDSIVEHLHVTNGKAEMDATYERSQREWDADTALYAARIETWAGQFR